MDAPLSIKRFLDQVKAKLEPSFAHVCLVGEVSNARTSGKHWYFTLKEEGASLQCAVWAGQQRFLKVMPKDGQRVVVQGSLNLYVVGGSLTFAVTHCESAGVGDLQQRLRELEAALRSEGLFDRPKRPLPRVPQRIGVIAALGGAALRDVLEVTGRRAPGIDIRVFPASAQGERCVPENLLALQELQDEFWGCDLILMVRGGGSLEDLWGFNDPTLVRAVAACRIPVITGVGHEIDTTLVDLAADRRAATPSQAAELATPDRQQLATELGRRFDALCGRMDWRLRGLESSLNMLSDSTGMRAVPLRLERLADRLAHVQHRLVRCEADRRVRQALEALTQRLHLAHPQRRLDQGCHRLALLRQRLRHTADFATGESDRPRLVEAKRRLLPAMMHLLNQRDHARAMLQTQLQGLDPTGPLNRGFVLATDVEGRPVTSALALPEQALLELRWKDGRRRARLSPS